MTRSDIRYEPASPDDYGQILELNEEAIPAVNRIDEQTLANLHQQAELLLVARSNDRLAGFALILNERADYRSPNFQYFKTAYDRFLYMDRIVVSEDHQRMGIGAGLYAGLFDATTDAPRVACEVNVRPPNPGSLSFHKTLGFQVVGEQDTDGGEKRVALMVREQPAGNL